MMIKFISNEGIGEVKGIFSTDHLIFILLSFLLIGIFLFFSRNDTKEIALKKIKVITFIILILEILKIIWNLTIRVDVKVTDYVPLYFCSLFIYALIGFSFFNGQSKISRFIYNSSKCFLIYGGIIGGLFFIAYPSTALPLHPLLHVLTFHSIIFHSLMVFVSLYVYKLFGDNSLKDIYNYSIFIVFFSVISLVLNYIFNQNFMLLMDPGEVPILQKVCSLVKGFYPFIAILGQSVGTFYLGYLFFIVLQKVKKQGYYK